MNSRERVLTTINHYVPDHVPNGLGGCETVGLHVLAYKNLQKLLGVKDTPPRIDTFMSNAVFEYDVITAMKGDIILLASPRMCQSDLRGKNHETHWKEQLLWDTTFRISEHDQFTLNENGNMVWKIHGDLICPRGSYFFDKSESSNLLADFDIPNPDNFNPLHELSEDMLRNLEKTAKTIYEETEFSICLGETITDLQISPGGMIGTFILIKEEPDIMKELLQKSVDAGLSQLKQLNQAVGNYVDILSIAHDFGDNRGVTMGDALWRDIYKPYYKQLFQGWRNITNMKINLHSCGSISSILDDLIECGIHIYNPVQISADNMDVTMLKRRFGQDVVFWGGGYDAQLFCPEDDYDTVYKKVSDTIKIFKVGGGYIFGGVHNLPADISEIHLNAMLDAWSDSKDYKSILRRII